MVSADVLVPGPIVSFSLNSSIVLFVASTIAALALTSSPPPVLQPLNVL